MLFLLGIRVVIGHDPHVLMDLRAHLLVIVVAASTVLVAVDVARTLGLLLFLWQDGASSVVLLDLSVVYLFVFDILQFQLVVERLLQLDYLSLLVVVVLVLLLLLFLLLQLDDSDWGWWNT